MTAIAAIVTRLFEPLFNPLLALAVLLSISWLRQRVPPRSRWRSTAVLGPVIFLFAAYHLAALHPTAHAWLTALNTPLSAVFLGIVLPAMLLPRNRWYKLFLLVPAAFLVLFAVGVYVGYGTVPADQRGFYGLLVRPSWMIAGVVSLLVLIQPLLSLTHFRRAVRGASFAVLLYGGFMLRQDFGDYQDMRSRRATQQDIMNLSETSPVIRADDKTMHLPSAPCRFAADGGYVQGCNLELFQRFLQINFFQLGSGDPAIINTLASVLAAMTLFFVFCVVTARSACGWLCPLSTAGDFMNWSRRKLGLPVMRPSAGLRKGFRISGWSLAGLGLGMAAVVPHLDENGAFAGCKIPLFPLCKLCPGQQICPVLGSGVGAYPALPTADWGFGLFRYGCLIILGLFVVSFMASRRLWCLFCPIGIISGVFNRGGMFTLRKKAEKCNKCGVCAEVCPMDIEDVRDDMEHPNVICYDCVLCMRCVEMCPRDGCLTLEHGDLPVIESRFERKR